MNGGDDCSGVDRGGRPAVTPVPVGWQRRVEEGRVCYIRYSPVPDHVFRSPLLSTATIVLIWPVPLFFLLVLVGRAWLHWSRLVRICWQTALASVDWSVPSTCTR